MMMIVGTGGQGAGATAELISLLGRDARLSEQMIFCGVCERDKGDASDVMVKAFFL